jgi:hypothetical protein
MADLYNTNVGSGVEDAILFIEVYVFLDTFIYL